MTHQITISTLVEFDTDHGTQRGIVTGLLVNDHGPRIAIIHVNGTQGGTPWQIPVDQLTVIEKEAA